jgi:DnaJ-class molecular chaperone
MTTCPTCHGTGQHIVMRFVRRYEKMQMPGKCPDCDGTGQKPPPKPAAITSKVTAARRTRRG